MPSTYTSSLRLTLQATGESQNTWGAILNTGVFQVVEQAISGLTKVAVSGPVTLSTANGAIDQARSMMLLTTGSGGTVTVPSVTKLYLVNNQGSGPMVFTTGAGTTATVAASSSDLIMCDGSNVVRVSVDAADMAAVLASARAYTDAAAFSSASGNLPGQSGNGGKFLTTDGTTPTWASVPQVNVSNNWTAAQTFSGGLSGNLNGNASSASYATNAGTATISQGVVAGGVTNAMMATGAAASNLGYVPANPDAIRNWTAPQSFFSGVNHSSGNGSFYFNATNDAAAYYWFNNNGQMQLFQAGQSAPLLRAGGQTLLNGPDGAQLVRIAIGTGGASGRINVATAAPTSLAVGEITLVVASA